MCPHWEQDGWSGESSSIRSRIYPGVHTCVAVSSYDLRHFRKERSLGVAISVAGFMIATWNRHLCARDKFLVNYCTVSKEKMGFRRCLPFSSTRNPFPPIFILYLRSSTDRHPNVLRRIRLFIKKKKKYLEF